MAGTVPRTRARARAIVRGHEGGAGGVGGLIAEAVRIARGGDEALGFEVFRAAPKVVAAMTAGQVEGLLKVLHDWKSTDAFGSFVSGVAWREGVLTDRQVMAWTRSADVWTRRAALVSTVPLNQPARGAKLPRGDARRTLAVCERLVDDHEDMVVKALSWALRTLASKDAAAVEAFVEEHKERLAARALRETRNKLRTGLKNPRKGGAGRRGR